MLKFDKGAGVEGWSILVIELIGGTMYHGIYGNLLSCQLKMNGSMTTKYVVLLSYSMSSLKACGLNFGEMT